MKLNQRSVSLLESVIEDRAKLNVLSKNVAGSTVIDFGVNAKGGIEAGLMYAAASCGGMANLRLAQHRVGNQLLNAVQIQTDSPLECCLAAQYAGWPIQHEKYFAMGSGPIRAVRGKEAILTELKLEEVADKVVLCLESSSIPAPDVVELIANEVGIDADQLVIAIAPTRSIAGSMQVVARSVETALHKLHELNFDLSTVICGMGIAPIPPIANDDLKGIGLTNDAILFGGQVDLWLKTEQADIDEIGPQVPSTASADYGTPFYELFKRNDFDFYRIDPKLFSPAQITFHNLASGQSSTFGHLNDELLIRSFGL